MLMSDRRMRIVHDDHSTAKAQYHICSSASMQIFQAAGTDGHHSFSCGIKQGPTQACLLIFFAWE